MQLPRGGVGRQPGSSSNNSIEGNNDHNYNANSLRTDTEVAVWGGAGRVRKLKLYAYNVSNRVYVCAC